MGKTPLAVLLAAQRLEKFPGSRVLVMAPTRPLVSQHFKTFQDFMDLPEGDFGLVTGMVKPTQRQEIYQEKKLIFATPQTIEKDLQKGKLSLQGFSLLVIDEAHHSIGRYAYPFVSKRYREESQNPRILALTASPGGTREKIEEICENLGIEEVEIRTEQDQDVRPYIKEKSLEWVEVSLPDSFERIRSLLKKAYDHRIESLKKWGFIHTQRINKRGLLALQKNLSASIRQGYKKAFTGMSYTVQAIKLEHALGLLETQGIGILEKYWAKLRGEDTNTARRLLNDKLVSNAMFLTNNLLEAGGRHPKMARLCTIVTGQLRENPESRIIIFANYRESVKEIVDVLSRLEGARPVVFVGQRLGITQREQVQIIKDFRAGEYNILVGTSISEEGLDIPAMNLAVFYEPVPSEIRSIQRRGRVGRQTAGRIIVLVTKNTRDEAYRWSAHHKELRMKGVLHDMKQAQKA
jgi:ERCC4-related helicase